jgi:hypothetical protein
MANKPVLHAHDHSHGGADPVRITWESTGEAGTGGGRTLLVVIDGAGSAITTGVKGDAVLYSDYTISGWTLLADTTGSISIDIWKDTYANYPPDSADSITGSAPPTISSDDKATSTTLTGWTTTFAAGDTLRFNVDSATTVTRATLALGLT